MDNVSYIIVGIVAYLTCGTLLALLPSQPKNKPNDITHIGLYEYLQTTHAVGTFLVAMTVAWPIFLPFYICATQVIPLYFNKMSFEKRLAYWTSFEHYTFLENFKTQFLKPFIILLSITLVVLILFLMLNS